MYPRTLYHSVTTWSSQAELEEAVGASIVQSVVARDYEQDVGYHRQGFRPSSEMIVIVEPKRRPRAGD